MIIKSNKTLVNNKSENNERLFSTDRDVVTAQRAHVLPKYVDMLVFLKNKRMITFNHLNFYVCFKNIPGIICVQWYITRHFILITVY